MIKSASDFKTIKGKLLLQYAFILLIAGTLAVVAFVRLNKILRYQETYRQVQHLNNLVIKIHEHEKDFILIDARDKAFHLTVESPAQILFTNTSDQAIKDLQSLTNDPLLNHDSLKECVSRVSAYRASFDQIVNLTRSREVAAANALADTANTYSSSGIVSPLDKQIGRNQNEGLRGTMLALSKKLTNTTADFCRQLEAEMEMVISNSLIILGVLVLMLLAGATVISGIFTRKISRGVHDMKESLTALSDGRVPSKIVVESEDEIGASSHAINNLIDRIETAATFAGKIGNGELHIQYDENFKNDVLATSLQSMHQQLKLAADDNLRRNWVTTGLANFGNILRTTDSDLTALCQNIITNVIKYLNANQGQLFIVTTENNEEHLVLMATYAWSKKKFLSRKIEKGEGLAGQAWLEKNTIYLKEIPKDYVQITSGLGEALPNCILIVPLKLNDEVFGIVEIGSFKAFENHEVEFVEKLAELLASSLATVKVNERTRQLLAESQHQTEELRAQEEEMRQNMEELTATQEEMARKDIEISGQLMAINNSMATIEFTMDGRVAHANDRFLQFTGYRLDEIKGKHHSFFLDEQYAASDEYQKFWKDLNNGIAQTGEFERVVRNRKKVWISASYTVVMNKQGSPLKVIKFALDITEQKLKSLDFEGQINAINRSMASIEFNLEGNITEVNDNFLNTMGYTRGEVIGRHHSIFVDSSHTQSAAYSKFWSDLRSGEAQVGEFKRVGKNNKEVWINASYAPIRDCGGKVYKVVKFAQDITGQKQKAVDFEGQLNAVNNTMASIEFSLEGNIASANANFLEAMGYTSEEIIGKHHSLFVDPVQVRSDWYKSFWKELAHGNAQTGEFKRLGKNGREIWINASYTPIKDQNGKVYKIIKFAQDITAHKMKSVDYEGQISAIRKSNAVIEFDLTGKILYANRLFLEAMGYQEARDVVDQHHSIFVSDFEVKSPDYKKFWERLQRGEFFTGEFQRKKADGQGIWIYGSYNPILDADGVPYKVVKYASVVNKNGQGVQEKVTAQ
jgi:PAS domain S-box-containing protein